MVSTLRIILDRVLSLLENNIVRILRVSKEVKKQGKASVYGAINYLLDKESV